MTDQAPESVALEMSRLERMAGFIGDFGVYRQSRRQARLSSMRSFISSYQERVERFPARFNLLALFKVKTREVRHSAFLAWLLDARESHKQGNLFLRAFLGACRPQLELAVPERYRVQTEFSWLESRIDILIYRPGQFILYIENKTTSPDTADQPDREVRDLRRLGKRFGIPLTAQIPIYLTPTGRLPPGDQAKEWRTAAYGDIRQAFENALPLVTEDKVKYAVDDWLETISAFEG